MVWMWKVMVKKNQAGSTSLGAFYKKKNSAFGELIRKMHINKCSSIVPCDIDIH